MKDRLRAGLSQLKQKWMVRKERRQIIALAAAGAFLLFSFWNSFQDNRLKSDLENVRIEETIQSGRMYVPHVEADFATVLLAEIDEQGRLKNISGDTVDPATHEIVDKLTLTPMKVNNIARPAKVPLTIPLHPGTQDSSQKPYGAKDSGVPAKDKHK